MASLPELLEYKRSLQAANTEDAKLFRSLLDQGMKLLGLIDKDVSHKFGLSRPSVTRWRNGKNAPHPALRGPVYRWLATRTNVSIARQNKATHPPPSAPAPTRRTVRGGRKKTASSGG